jgi:hypothetical protein
MSGFLALATETGGRRASQRRFGEGGRYLGIPPKRVLPPPSATGGPGWRLTAPGAEPQPTPNLSPVSLSHFRGSVHCGQPFPGCEPATGVTAGGHNKSRLCPITNRAPTCWWSLW